MAVVKGTNAGFVSSAPSTDPGGSDEVVDARSIAVKDTSPATATRITEIGWWCDNATEEANFEVGVYNDSGAGVPEYLKSGVSRTNAKGTGAGWKVVSGLDIQISPSTIYWISVQLDNTATATNNNRSGAGGEDTSEKTSATTLPSDWGTESNGYSNIYAIYAVWEAVEDETTTIAHDPGTMADNADVGTLTWALPYAVATSDNIDSTANTAAPPLATTHYLKATNFGFNIPSDATINGIKVEIEKRGSINDGDNDYVRDKTIKIIKADGTLGTTNKAVAGNWDTTDTYVTYGSSSDLWGETWAPGDINDADFGVVISADILTGGGP